MTAPSETAAAVRQLQAWAVLLSCLPPDGKARELFTHALSLDEGPWLDRLAPLVDPEGDEGISAWLGRIGPPADAAADDALKEWLEYLWIRGTLSPREQELVDWQCDSDNMTTAVAEYLTVVDTLLGRVRRSPAGPQDPEGAAS
jgi:hypothetical protein